MPHRRAPTARIVDRSRGPFGDGLRTLRDSRFSRVAKCYRERPRGHLKGSVVHEAGSLSTAHPALSTRPGGPDPLGSGRLVGVEELAKRVDVPPEAVVLTHL